MGMGSESSRQMEGPQGVPSTAARVCPCVPGVCPGQAVERLAPAPHKHRPKCSRLSIHFHIGQFISTLTTTPSQARHPCAVHNLNACTNQPSAASSSFPQARHQIKSMGQKTWLLLGQWSLPPQPPVWTGGVPGVSG